MMDYLNQDHPILQHSQALCSYAVDKLLEYGLQRSHKFRLQFDRLRLERVIGNESFTKLMPNFQFGVVPDSSHYYVYEDCLSNEKIEILRRILSLTPEGYSERPLNYIRSVRLLDQGDKTVLRGGDRNAFILFDLHEADRSALVEAYRQQHIPEEVIEQVDVDPEMLEP